MRSTSQPTRSAPTVAERSASVRDTASEEPIVRIQGLRKRFPLRRSWRETILKPRDVPYQEALCDVSLEVARGEFFGLLGRNGAGKTTLFKILSTLILPDEGRIRVDGIDVLERPEEVRRRLVPVIPYERSLYWRLSAWENVRLYATLQGYAGRDALRRTAEVLELVGLENAGRKQVGLFSTGMRQRLLVARALISDPDILLLDEPTRSLDPVSARDLRRFLREEVNQRKGCTVLLATHNAEEVHDLCDRVGILDEGRLLAAGTTDDLLRAVGRPRYELRLRGSFETVLRRLTEEGLVLRVHRPGERDAGWHRVAVELTDGADAPARLVSELVHAQIDVGSMAPQELQLAELIESVVRRGASDPGEASS
jgi:ABC-2 type transport system ATP-binding protein